MNQLSQEQVLKTLVTLGFEEIGAQIYVYLSKKGLIKASDICKALKLTKQQFYPSIKQLQSQGIVNSTIEHPARFSVMPFEKVLDLFIEAKMEEAERLQQSKEAILSNWQSLKLEDDTTAKFTVIQGRTFIFTKIQQMIQETRSQILAITTFPVLAQANERDIFDASYSRPLKSKVIFRFLTELHEQNAQIVKSLLNDIKKVKLNVEGRTPDLESALFPQMLLRDGEEALFFTKPRTKTSIIEKDDTCLWTDCKSLVKAFNVIFEGLWQNSTDIREKFSEIETGRSTSKTFTIRDPETARAEYNKIVESAQEEVLIMTSAQGLSELCKDKTSLNELAGRGVAFKIMAPIVEENLEAVKNLSKTCSVRHVPPNYLPTTVIDGKVLFQFTESFLRDRKLNSPLQFENVLYTTAPEYVQKTRNMLNAHWLKSPTFPADNLESIFESSVRVRSAALFPGVIRSPGPFGTLYPLAPDPSKKAEYQVVEIVDDDPQRKLTEQDVVHEIIMAKRKAIESQVYKLYSSQAIAVIHPPDFFNLPPLLIRVHHIEKQSTFGAQGVIMINLWRETPFGFAFVPVAVLGDKPEALPFWKGLFAASPAGRNVQLAKKDELQIRVHGNSLFAGWTVPIPLMPPNIVLPPACILFEGYGEVRTAAYTIRPPGIELRAKLNGFNAFVNFMHPSSNYSGPGTDGFVVRDFVADVTPSIKDGSPPFIIKLVERGRT